MLGFGLIGKWLVGDVGRAPLPVLLTDEQRYKMALEAIAEVGTGDGQAIARRALEEA